MRLKRTKNDGLSLVDGDIVAYAVSSACDGRYYKLVDGTELKYKKEAISYCKKNGITEEPELLYDPEDWADVENSLEHFMQDVLEFSHCSSSKVYLTGRNNFRYSIATILPYKGNRKDQKMPHWLPSCREHLIEEWGATFKEGLEADDLLGLAQQQDGSTVICSSDKDLLTIPGRHYNFNSKKLCEVTIKDAYRKFYEQVLTGDSTDNILGLHKIGTKNTVVKKIWQMEDIDEIHDVVYQEYKSRFGNYAQQFMVETCKLVWIHQELPKVWATKLDVKDNYWEV